MRSRIERHARAATIAVVLATSTLRASPSRIQSATAPGPPDSAEITRAIAAVRADPNLGTERTIKTLRWRRSSLPATKMPAWLSWIVGFFTWVGESARVLVWCTAAGLAGLLVVYMLRIVRRRVRSASVERFVAPTHVRDLDIRPETLPDDVGAAARALWARGEQRASLALLYRGMLSRLAHVHGVPIRDSSTEGDCLALAAARLPAEPTEYVSRLVRVWQRFGYGRESVDTAAVYHLCDEFMSALRPVPAIDGAAEQAAI